MKISSIGLCFVAVLAAVSACSYEDYKRYGDPCTCTDFCLDNSHCQHDGSGGYTCQCLPCLTYDRDQRQCVPTVTDVDKCADTVNPPCEQICLNVDKGFNCTCRPGFVVDATDPTKCQDIDECKQGPCGDICNNFPGGYNCSCRNGYEPTPSDPTKCQDENECLKRPCQHTCANSVGGFNCSCRDGYVVSPSDPTKCLDINECLSKPCEQVCTNTLGSYKCSCQNGLAVKPSDPTKCQAPICVEFLRADIYFLADSSNSINSIGWGRTLVFIVNTTKAFHLGPNDVQAAFGIFSSRFEHNFNLNNYTDQDEFAKAVLGTVQLKQNTYTYDALSAINTQGFLTSPQLGARNVPKILIVITDGQSNNIARTITEADNLRKKNITLLSVGVGALNQIELLGIAENEKNVFNVKTFSVLDTIRGEITQRVCDVPEAPEVKPCTDNFLFDLVFVIDSSNKLGSGIYEINYVFVSYLIRAFRIDENSTKVALLLYDGKPVTVFNLTSSINIIYQSLVSAPNKTINTNTYLGLIEALKFFDPVYGGRPNANKAIIFVTDGQSNDPINIIQQAEQVKNQGVNVFTIGILPEADDVELSIIASKPEYNFSPNGYGNLVSLAGIVSDFVCKAPPAI